MINLWRNHYPSSNDLAALVGKTALIYCLLGILGVSLGKHPDYVSPVFPAAGFAVASMIFSEQRAWPGIWLGSVVLNFWLAITHDGITIASVITSAGIATGATLQAVVAYWLIRRSVVACRSLEMARDIVVNLFWAGPVACVISASIGTSTLSAINIIRPSDYFYSWWNWWTGDALGVVLVMPLSMAIYYRYDAAWRRRLTTVIVPTLATLIVVIVVYLATANWERDKRAAALQQRGHTIAQLLEQRFVAHQEVLSSLRRLVEVMPDMTLQQFEYFTAITLKDNPDIFALSFNSYVPQKQRVEYEKSFSIRSENPAFEIKERNHDRQLVRAVDRTAYVPVSYIAPLEGNRPAIGYDIFSEPIRHKAIVNAISSREPAMTAPIQLVQDNRKQTGMLVLHPAFQNDKSGTNPKLVSHPFGFAVAVIKAEQMIGIAIQSALVDGLSIEIKDTETRQLLYRSAGVSQPAKQNETSVERIVVADRSWDVRVWVTDEYAHNHRSWITWAVGAAGLIMAALLQVLMLVTTGQTAIVQRKVQEQTQELRKKSKELEDLNAQLNVLFTLSPDGLVALSPEGIVKFVNPAFQAMTGISELEIVGSYGEEFINKNLCEKAENPENFPGISNCFVALGQPLNPQTLIFRTPNHTVLQFVGIRSESAGVSHILYSRDITKEAEIDRLKSEFLSHAAHELRTPIACIYGFSELLLERDLDAKTRRDLLETIHRQTRWLADIVNELLDLARIEAKQGKDFKIESIELLPLVQKTLDDLSFDAKRWPVTLHVDKPIIMVKADRAKLRQALINVLDNAQKYSPEGGVIEVEIVSKNRMSGITVRDHGIGMNPGEIERIGERFWRADTSGSIPGTGLGMAIVVETLQIFGGKLDVFSVPDSGTAVTLWLQESILQTETE